MVGVLIRLRAAQRAHLARSLGTGWLVAAGVVALVSAGGTLWLGVLHYSVPGAGADVVALALALWVLGPATQSALSGTETLLPPGLLTLLPLDVPALARAYVVLGLRDPATVILGVACGALLALGSHGGVAVALVAVGAWLLTVALAAVGSTLVGLALTPVTRRGRDAATILPAVAISAVAVAGTLLPLLIGTLAHRSSPGLSWGVRLFPSGWGAVAVDAAGRSRPGLAAAALAGLAALVTGLAAAVPGALTRRLENSASVRTSPPARRPRGRRRLPATPTGAVASVELRLWLRDPTRLTSLVIAVLVGAGTAVAPWLGSGTVLLLPFGGLLGVVIAAAVASNLYGAEGTGIWLLVMTPGSSRADVRGRQLAWLLVVAPVGAAMTLAGTAASGRSWAWPWALGLLPALVGGGAGVLVLASVTSVLPPSPTGGPTPAWSLKVQLCLYLVALTAVPAAAALVVGTATGHAWLAWLAVPVGVLSGAGLAWWLGAVSARRLERRQVELLARAQAG